MANPKKTKVMTFNCPSKVDIITSDGSILEEVNDCIYLGSLVSSSRADIAEWIGLAWATHNKMSRIWRSTLSRKTKTRLFRSTVESVFLYGNAVWTLTRDTIKENWWLLHQTTEISIEIHFERPCEQQRTIRRSTKSHRHSQTKRLKLLIAIEAASNLMSWTHNHGKRGQRRTVLTFVQQLRDDNGP